jgi:thiamine biosynthesis lipoprotein
MLLQKDMQLDLGGIAKGFVAQKVVSFLQAHGVSSALADAGGDMACSQPPPGKKGWTVGINVPESTTEILPQTIQISNSAIATSGDLYQYMEHEGTRYSHILDPRTGYGVPFQRNVTILAPDGATADWLATACSILSLRQCKKLVKQHGAELLITQMIKGKVKYYMTKGMKRRLRL